MSRGRTRYSNRDKKQKARIVALEKIARHREIEQRNIHKLRRRDTHIKMRKSAVAILQTLSRFNIPLPDGAFSYMIEYSESEALKKWPII